MYLKKLKLTNTGPIQHAKIECLFDDDGYPNPIIFVGKNGSGKSLAIAHVVNALINAHSTVFENSDVEKGKVYKMRSADYIRHDASYSAGEISFSNGFNVSEIQLIKSKNRYEEPLAYPKWTEIPDNQTSYYTSDFGKRLPDLKNCLNRATHIYFPPNRFEEPAWLNKHNLRNQASYPALENFSNYSNRPVINYAPLRDLQDWLLDLIYDRFAVEKNQSDNLPCPATQILHSIERILKIMFDKQGHFTWHVGSRNNRRIGVYIKNQESRINNLFGLSTGETVLLDLFLTIIRDFDLSDSQLSDLSDIKGIVIVDEIDLHLHADLQHDILPNLIRLFPRVQFILSTHAPLFLMGMRNIFNANGFQLFELPTGQEIDVERFSEFEAAFKYMRNSIRFEEDMLKRIEENQKPILYLEGTTDSNYLRKAAKVLGKTDLLDKFELKDTEGSSNLNNIWNTLNKSPHLSVAIKQKCLLLYDCDVNKDDGNKGKLFRRTIPQQENHKIRSGIENLFSDETIQKAYSQKTAFVDITEKHTSLRRGAKKDIPEQWEINKDEKRNLCDWLCENGQSDDFEKFSLVFDILDGVLNSDTS